MYLPRWKRNQRSHSRPNPDHPDSHHHDHHHDDSNHRNQSGNNGNRYQRHDRRHNDNRWNNMRRNEQGHVRQNREHQTFSQNQSNRDTGRHDSARGLHPRRQVASSISHSPSQSGSLPGSQSGGSDTSSNQPKIKHLPGFYYDPEKKKYFRLLPGHNNHNPITNDGLQLKAAEEQRVQMIQGGGAKERLTVKANNCKRKSVLQLLRNQQLGHLKTKQFDRCAHEQCISELPVKPTGELKPFPDNYFNGEEGSIAFLKMDPQQGRVLMVIQDAFLSRIWQGTVQCGDKESGQVDIDNWGTVNILGTRSNKITNVEWASSDMNGDIQVLYTVSGDATSIAQVVRCYQDQTSTMERRWKKEFVFGAEVTNEMIWTCAWNHNSQLEPQFSLGSSRKAVVFGIENSSRTELYSGHSDVLTQVYSLRQPVLYNGTRRGEILGCDLRKSCQRRADITSQLKHRVCVCSMQILKDENYLLAGDISGKVRLWDIRMCRWVYSYEGLTNKHSHLPVRVDSSETVVYGAGIDKCTRFWSLQDGRLLHTIPSPLPLNKDGVPVPVYSRQWYGGATPGLILGMERQLFWYSLSL